jgi:hypothetical protein
MIHVVDCTVNIDRRSSNSNSDGIVIEWWSIAIRRLYDQMKDHHFASTSSGVSLVPDRSVTQPAGSTADEIVEAPNMLIGTSLQS